jgi:hypothetical protein
MAFFGGASRLLDSNISLSVPLPRDDAGGEGL